VIFRTLQLWLAPIVGALLTLWAAVVALAAEAYAPLPRMLALRELPEETGLPSIPRRLHLIRLALLLVAGAIAATAVGWWAHPASEAVPRFLLPVFLVWLVGDLLPRVLAAIAPDLVEAVQGIGRVSLRVFDPLLRLIARAGRRNRLKPSPGAVVETLPVAPEHEMLQGVFALRDMTVAEVMTPRIDITGVDLAHAREDVVEAFRGSGHSRLPVFDGQPDAVVGVIYAKDLLPRGGEQGELEWRSLVRPAAFVPEAKLLATQLRDFQRGPGHLAVVVDEFGGTAGLITLEDILEQIVGEIQDEYDLEEAAPIIDQGAGRWVVQGGVALAELEGHLEHDFHRDDVDTVGGLVLAALGHVPRVGESVDLGVYRLVVDQVGRRRVGRVIVESVAPATVEPKDGPA